MMSDDLFSEEELDRSTQRQDNNEHDGDDGVGGDNDDGEADADDEDEGGEADDEDEEADADDEDEEADADDDQGDAHDGDGEADADDEDDVNSKSDGEDRSLSFSFSSDLEFSTSFDENTPDSDEVSQENLHSSQAEGIASDGSITEDTQKRRRSKRGGFKRGFLKQKKGKRSRSQGSSRSSSGTRTEDYADKIKSVLSSDLSVNAEDDVDKTVSCSSAFPSAEESAEEEKLKDEEGTKGKSKRGRGKKSIGRKRKSHRQIEEKNVTTDALHTVHPPNTVDKATSMTEILDVVLDAASKEPSSEHLSTIASYLRLTLGDGWFVSADDRMLSISSIINQPNPFVERAITWDGSKVNFLVHNMPLPPKNVLWHLKRPDPQNFGKVADFLTAVAQRFLNCEICDGIQSNECLWEKFSEISILENHRGPTLRSKKCSLTLVYPGRCLECHKILTKILDIRRKQLKKEEANRDESKINYRYLGKEEVKKRLEKIHQEQKLTKQQVKRLKNRIDSLLEKNSEKVGKDLSDDFVQIMNENSEKMTAIEKLFWEQQSVALSKREASRTMRWHPAMIRLALQLRKTSPAAYDIMKGFLSLPSQRRLFDYSQFTNIQEGVQEDLLQQFHEKVEKECLEDYQKYFTLLLDEMSIRSGLVYNAGSGELIGFTNLSSVEEELAALEFEIQSKTYEKKLAKKVLVFMLIGAVCNLRFVPAVYTTDDLSAAQLYIRTWEVIYAVEESSAKILNILFDGAGVNRKFITMHFNSGETDLIHVTLNTASGETRPLYFMLDPPHLLKTFRNCFANSNAHRKSRRLCNNEQELSWKAIEALYEILQEQKYRDTKITKAHVYLSSFSCMKVSLAAQIFSKAVARAIQKYKDCSPLKECFSEELVIFILKMDRWFDCFNGCFDSKKKIENPDLAEYRSPDDSRFEFLEKEFLEYLYQWETFVATRKGKYSKDQRSRMIISHQSLEAIKITIKSFIAIVKFLLSKNAPYVSARNFNQDPLEQYFFDQRRFLGANNNPTAKQVFHSRLTLHSMGQMTSGGKRSNTEDLRQMTIDDTPLPVRKKQKKM